MDQQSSNANMPRDTVETLKQIQKQGLSVSIVKSTPSFILASPVSSENKTKQNVLPADKVSKSIPIAPRPQAVTENKTQVLQTRLSNNTESRLSTGRVAAQTAFHDPKAAQNQIKPNQSTLPENKGFSTPRSVHMPMPDKSQGATSHPVATTAANKMQTCPTRVLLPDNKTPVSRSSQNILVETKTQSRVTPGQRVSQNQHLIEGKIQTNQDRVNLNPTSPPETKVFSNQIRTGQQFIITQDNKTIPVQRVTPLKSTEVKSVSQISINKQDGKTSQVNRMAQNVKVTSEITQNKARQNFIIKDDGKFNIASSSPVVVENKINSVRMVANTIDSSSIRTTQSKSSTQMRMSSNATGNETQTAVQTKMICSTVVSKMICYQRVQGMTEKNMILQGAQAASDVIKKTATVFDMSTEASTSDAGTPSSTRIATSKRSSVFTSTPVKKKSVKRAASSSAEINSKNIEGSNISSSEEGNENAAQLFNNLKKASRTGLTITPVQSSISPMPSSTSSTVNVIKSPGEFLENDAYRLAFEKAHMGRSPRGKSRARGRRRYVEPVCLTLSSDDEEEHMQAHFNNFDEEAFAEARMFPQESEDGSKSGQSSPAYQDENDPGCDDDPEFPGVTNIPCQRTPDHHFPGSEEDFELEEEDEEEEGERELDEMEVEEGESMGEEEEEEMEQSEVDEEDEEVPPEEDDEQSPMKGTLENITGVEQPLRCRSVRIGSFKVHPKPTNTTMNVYLASDGISFNAPMVSDCNKIVNITLKPGDITQMLVHFGKCLPILFVLTTPNFAEAIRKSLNMTENKLAYYDPTSNDEKIKKITFLIDNVNEEQRRFLRHSFLNDKKVRELDQKTANEILVTSTPSQNHIIRCEPAQPQPQHIPISSENLISVTTMQTAMPTRQTPLIPVTRLLTYPPPPQTGGIPITNEDLACLNEGEFLNDAIIDFYLKYIYNEKLSEYNRDKTHIFSSYFFPRLTYKPERARAEDVPKNVQMRRHSQVKTWTRHVDIFSKDFIIIPVNQNVHWFLAIICYPGLVPEAPEGSVKSESKTNKSCDNVTSSDDQDEGKQVKEASSTVDGNNVNSDENSIASNSSMFEQEEPDSEETMTMPEAADSSTHPEQVCRRKEVPCICIFDSLNGPNRSRIVTLLREYLEIEWKVRKGTRKVFDKTTMQGYIMQCPQQNNYSDCGIYVLQYVESFFENPIPYFDSPIPNLSNWFPKEKMAKKRQELKDLILSLQKKYSSTPAAKSINAPESVPSTQASQTLQTDNR